MAASESELATAASEWQSDAALIFMHAAAAKVEIALRVIADKRQTDISLYLTGLSVTLSD